MVASTSIPGANDVPQCAPSWFRQWLAEAERETKLLVANGAAEAAHARCRAVVSCIEAFQRWLDEELTTEEAATEVGCCTETIRRAARDSGVLPASRSAKRGPMRIRRGDLHTWHGGYDPVADAVRLTRKRRPRE
jgi:excisionase family DNA binding protein